MVDPLPVVKARIAVPPTSVAPAMDQQAAPPPAAALDAPAASAPKTQEANASIDPIRASALKGQVLSWWLAVSNTGTATPSFRPITTHDIAWSTDGLVCWVKDLLISSTGGQGQ